MNRFYEKGRRFEYIVMNFLKDKFNIVLRSSGSHSPIDILGIDTTNNRILLIQCKKGKDFQINFIKDMEVIFINLGEISQLKDFLNF
ncbi:MAG: hypothetical protein N3D74_04550 [Caldisericia bacterium]|nr:hypothetical protein [Caldisericia bacterium]